MEQLSAYKAPIILFRKVYFEVHKYILDKVSSYHHIIIIIYKWSLVLIIFMDSRTEKGSQQKQNHSNRDNIVMLSSSWDETWTLGQKRSRNKRNKNTPPVIICYWLWSMGGSQCIALGQVQCVISHRLSHKPPPEQWVL